MKFTTIIQTGYGPIKLKHDLPRIPVKDEVIRVATGEVVRTFVVTNILWDLDNLQVIIDCD